MSVGIMMKEDECVNPQDFIKENIVNSQAFIHQNMEYKNMTFPVSQHKSKTGNYRIVINSLGLSMRAH